MRATASVIASVWIAVPVMAGLVPAIHARVLMH
jgi:hypothetical protein